MIFQQKQKYQGIMAMHTIPPKRKEIYKYEAPWPLYSMNWSVRPDKRFRLALGSFVEEYNNKVQIVSLDEETSEFSAKSTFDHPYPTTKIMWIPDSKGTYLYIYIYIYIYIQFSCNFYVNNQINSL